MLLTLPATPIVPSIYPQSGQADKPLAQPSSCTQGNTQQAIDIINTGLAHQTGSGHTRLQLAMAEVQAAKCNWVRAEFCLLSAKIA